MTEEEQACADYVDELQRPGGGLHWLGWATVAAAVFWFGGGALTWWLAS